MPDVQHSALTTGELHEPKGAAGASNGQVLTANGSGGTSFLNPVVDPSDAGGAGEIPVADGAGDVTWEDPNVYAAIFTEEADSVSVSSIGTTPIQLPIENNGISNGMTADAANNRITVLEDGDYDIQFNSSFGTVAGGDSGTYEFDIAINGTATVYQFSRYLSGTSDRGNGSVKGFLALSAGDHITVQVLSDNGGQNDDLNIFGAALNVKLLRRT